MTIKHRKACKQCKKQPRSLRRSVCKLCDAARSRQYYRRNRVSVLERVKHYQQQMPVEKKQLKERKRTLRRYGMELHDYDKLLKQQHNKCAICECKGNGKRLVVDHDHKTGKVRGLLCTSCNIGIGLLDDSAERILQALEYISDRG